MSHEETQGNPAVVGLAGFGLTTMVLQFHNVGWCGVGPIVAPAFIFGGLAQMIAGFQEFKYDRVDYMWPKPGKNTPAKKTTYIYKVPDQDVFVGAGVYVGGMLY